MDVRYINPFVESVDSVFSMMVGLKAERSAVKLTDGSANGDTAITGVIGISGALNGVVVLRLPSRTAIALASRMLGTSVAEMGADVFDAISELTNMVAGSAKAKFDVHPPLQLGLPTIVQGSDYRLAYPSNSSWLQIPYTTEEGPFTLDVTFRRKDEVKK